MRFVSAFVLGLLGILASTLIVIGVGQLRGDIASFDTTLFKILLPILVVVFGGLGYLAAED